MNGLEAECPGGGSSQDDETISVVTFDSQTASCKLQLSRASDSQSTTVGHNDEDFIEIQVGRHASGSEKLSLSSHEAAGVTPARRSPSEPISTLCHTMKRQIISRYTVLGLLGIPRDAHWVFSSAFGFELPAHFGPTLGKFWPN